jgi:Domain of unknown function (DUF4253)
MSKFKSLQQIGTTGMNYGVSTKDIIKKLEKWDKLYGVTLNKAEEDTVDITLQKLPDDMDAFAAEVYAFCPDSVDQGFGLMCEDDAEPDPDDPNCMAHICVDVDFADPNFGLHLLRNAIEASPRMVLWWD